MFEQRQRGAHAVGPGREVPPCSRPAAAGPLPAELSNCRSASGRIIYVERVDPDGDGDAHFVLVSREAITGPGLSGST